MWACTCISLRKAVPPCSRSRPLSKSWVKRYASCDLHTVDRSWFVISTLCIGSEVARYAWECVGTVKPSNGRIAP